MDCDVIIYDALDSDLDEIKLAIKSFFYFIKKIMTKNFYLFLI